MGPLLVHRALTRGVFNAVMLLHHFTAFDYLVDIFAKGLSRGDVPTTQIDGKNAVWLTSDPNPSGHGLYDLKRRIRMDFNIPSHDRHLHHWPKWAKRRVDPDWYKTLDETGGGKSDTWWLYFGTLWPTEAYDLEEGTRYENDLPKNWSPDPIIKMR